MALHGELKVNYNEIGKWSAVRAGRAEDGDFIYRCRIEYRDEKGYPLERLFFIKHAYGDGAVALTAKVMLKADERLKSNELWGEASAWAELCDEHDLNPYSLLD